jgi:AcrR family transcriptional regulator
MEPVMRRAKLNELDPATTVDKEDKILLGAMQEFLAHGYVATSMDRVAAAAGVSKATVYSYFKDKEGLFNALMSRLAQERIMDIELQLEPPELALRQLAETLIKKMESDRQFLRFLRLVVGESERFPELAQMFIRNFAQIVIERLTSYLASRPELNLPDPEATARIFLGAILYVIVTQELLHGKEIIPIHRDRIVDGLMHLILGSKNHG